MRSRTTRRNKVEAVLEELRAYESRNVTYIDPNGGWPIVWERARGVEVWDVTGKKYLDLTAAFGVAAAGHANPRVVQAGQAQMARLLHAMGDVHPHALKARLARELSRITFERWPARGGKAPCPGGGKTIFCSSGFEAVEAALKTAILATGRKHIIAFEGAYHGVGYGALNATHRKHFRGPFLTQLGRFGHFIDFPAAGNDGGLEDARSSIERRLRGGTVGAILVEPVQVRGGVRIPHANLLPLLRRLCTRYGALLILDEIYTGFGRTGRWFACEHSEVVPDLICLGKALTGGFPLSACVGRADLMDRAWPPSEGEAIHTSTFLGHPVGCAMALAQIKEIDRQDLIRRSARLGQHLLTQLSALSHRITDLRLQARGIGLLAGLEVRHPDGRAATDIVLGTIQELLRSGYILLPEGEPPNVIGFTPPLTISKPQLDASIRALEHVLRRPAK
jgi:4-aminobutyrate aminotransferase-like enzyme